MHILLFLGDDDSPELIHYLCSFNMLETAALQTLASPL